MAETEGASLSEQLVGACLRDQPDLLKEAIETITAMPDEKQRAKHLNETKSPMGKHLLHLAAENGHNDIVHILLDQENFEVDSKTFDRNEDTPLHSAVRGINDRGPSLWGHGEDMVHSMLECGCDPRIRNRHGQTPRELTDPKNTELAAMLKDWEQTRLEEDMEEKDKSGGTLFDMGDNGRDDAEDDDGSFSGSDEDERAAWEASRGKGKGRKK